MKLSRRSLLAGIGAGTALAAALLIAGCGSTGAASPATSSTQHKDPKVQAKELATTYLDALVKADTATLMAADQDHAKSLQVLSADAYAKALKAKPVTATTVGEPKLDTSGLVEGKVPVSYTIAGQKVDAQLSVHDFDRDGELELTAGLGTSMFFPGAKADLGTSVNGSPIKAGEKAVYVLPGSYSLTFKNPHYALDHDVVVAGKKGEIGEKAEITLSPTGTAKFHEQVMKAVDACIAKKTFDAGCGIKPIAKSSNGFEAIEGTVERTLSETARAEVKKETPRVDQSDASKVTGSSVKIRTTMDCTKGGSRGRCELFLGGGTGVPSVDLTDPAAPVTWS